MHVVLKHSPSIFTVDIYTCQVYFYTVMEYTTFSLRLPKEIVDALDAEAFQEFHRLNARTLLITKILADRHKTKAPPTPTQQPANASRAGRKIKVNSTT